MLPPFIIEQIRQREEEKRRDDRPVLQLPLDDLAPRGGRPPAGRRRHGGSGSEDSTGTGEYGEERSPEGDRGITIIQF